MLIETYLARAIAKDRPGGGAVLVGLYGAVTDKCCSGMLRAMNYGEPVHPEYQDHRASGRAALRTRRCSGSGQLYEPESLSFTNRVGRCPGCRQWIRATKTGLIYRHADRSL